MSVSGKTAPTVLQVLPALETGGVERGTVDVALSLKAADQDPLVASAGGPLVRQLQRAGVRHFTLPLEAKNPLSLKRNAMRLARLIREEGVDIIHARSRAPAWSALWAARQTGARFMTTFHGTYNLGPAGIKRSYNRIMTRGERVIANSHFIAGHMKKEYGEDFLDRLRVVPRGVDVDLFSPGNVTASRVVQLAEQWRLPADQPIILMPGRLTRWKGQGVLIDALARLGRRDIRCIFLGSAQGRCGYVRELKKQAAAKGVDGLVQIEESCSDMPAAYMHADIVVSASTDPEAFGRVAVEAQAMGRPVLATAHGGALETVQENVTGRLVPPGDPAALATAIQWGLALGEEERACIAKAGRENAVSRFSRAGMCSRVREIYSELADGPAA